MVATTAGHEFAQKLPEMMVDSSIVNPNFFGKLWEMVKVSSSIKEVFVNSTAAARHKMSELFAGSDSHVAEARGAHELSFEQYKNSREEPSLIEYSALAAVSKFFRDHKPGSKDELIVTVDTINYVKQGTKWDRMEKPESLTEATHQVDTLLNADYFLSANGSAIGIVGESGHFGASVWVMPIRFRFPDEEVKNAVRANIIEHLETIFSNYDQNKNQLRPGGVSSAADILLPYLEFGVFKSEADHEVLGKISKEQDFFDKAGDKVKWLKAIESGVRSAEKPDYVLVGLASTVIGASPYGFANAVRRFLHIMAEDEGRSNKNNLKQCNFVRQSVMKMIGISPEDALLL